MAPSRGRSRPKPALEERIVDAALDMARETGWEGVRLRAVADTLDVPLAAVLDLYRDLDAVANAWFGRALGAMLAPVERGFWDLPARQRLHLLMLRWFDALAPHRRATAEMLRAKTWLFHPHHAVPMVFDLSRLIQWLRDAAGLAAAGRRRQVEEIGLTVLLLMTLAVWCRDETDGQAGARRFLARRLTTADCLMARMAGGARR